MESDFQAVIQEIVLQLNEHSIRYCLVGGLAATLRGRMRNTEHVETQITLDLAIGISGFERQVVSRSESLSITAASVNVATAEDLILMKVLAWRPQDEQDIAGIIATRGNTIDWNYCETVARQLEEAVAEDLVERIRNLRR